MLRHLSPFVPLLLAGCGHPATLQECNEIVERVARLELQENLGKTHPGAVDREVKSTQTDLQESTMKDCVGKRITGSAMECVRSAKTSKEIVEECFD